MANNLHTYDPQKQLAHCSCYGDRCQCDGLTARQRYLAFLIKLYGDKPGRIIEEMAKTSQQRRQELWNHQLSLFKSEEPKTSAGHTFSSLFQSVREHLLRYKRTRTTK